MFSGKCHNTSVKAITYLSTSVHICPFNHNLCYCISSVHICPYNTTSLPIYVFIYHDTSVHFCQYNNISAHTISYPSTSVDSITHLCYCISSVHICQHDNTSHYVYIYIYVYIIIYIYIHMYHNPYLSTSVNTITRLSRFQELSNVFQLLKDMLIVERYVNC